MPDPLIETAKLLAREDTALWRQLRVVAALAGCTLRVALRQALIEYIDNHAPKQARP